jgi:hypothetical protein
MIKLLNSLFLICIVVLLQACAALTSGPPSADARGMPGALGVIDYKPQDVRPGETTWWKDTDGVDPGTAGCHIGTDKDGNPNGRMFGEACLPDGKLVESNPGAGVLHSHTDDTGHPDLFDCSEWCRGHGSSDGICVAAQAQPCGQSAKCQCTVD